MKEPLPDILAPYKAHGCEFDRRMGNEWRGTAPWSTKPSHLYVNAETGQWKEHHTGDGGNRYTFLSLMASLYEANFTLERAQQFARRFRMPVEAVRELGIGWDNRCSAATFPYRNSKGTTVDIRRRGLELKSKTTSTAGCNVGMWGHELLARSKPDDLVYLVEGETDRIAWMWLLRKLKKPGITVAVPGAGIFKEEWVASFRDRKVRILFDNDDAGRAGTAKVAALLMKGAGR